MTVQYVKGRKSYDNIHDALKAFRCPCPCVDCDLSYAECYSTPEWQEEHCYELAKKMGYDVVVDGQNELDSDNPKPTPRLCEILGVAVGQLFRIHYIKGDTNALYIDEDGFVNRYTVTKSRPKQKIGNSVAYAVNHPESVERLWPDKVIKCPCCGKEIILDGEQ